MSQAVPLPPPGFDELSIDEQVQYVERLIEYAASKQEHLKVPEWHWEILRQRLVNFREELEAGKSWEEFEKELEHELTQS